MARGLFKITSKFYAGRIFDVIRSLFLHGIVTCWPMGIRIESALAGSLLFRDRDFPHKLHWYEVASFEE